jgi:hypothetical protein
MRRVDIVNVSTGGKEGKTCGFGYSTSRNKAQQRRCLNDEMFFHYRKSRSGRHQELYISKGWCCIFLSLGSQFGLNRWWHKLYIYNPHCLKRRMIIHLPLLDVWYTGIVVAISLLSLARLLWWHNVHMKNVTRVTGLVRSCPSILGSLRWLMAREA